MTKAGIHADGLLKDEEIYNIFDTKAILNRPPMVAISDISGLSGIAYWVNSYYHFDERDSVDKNSQIVKKIKEWIDNEYANGRITVISNEELDCLYQKYSKENESISELQIAKELNVSRTPVREAIMQLEIEGLVKNIPNKGAVVIGVSEKDIEDIYAIRVRVEGFASRLSAKYINEDEIEALKKIVDLQEFYLLKNNIKQIWELDSEFHSIIYNSSRSRPLRFMLSNFHNYIKHARDISFGVEGRAIKSVYEHQEILEAICLGDSELAEEKTVVHIENAKENLLKNMQK